MFERTLSKDISVELTAVISRVLLPELREESLAVPELLMQGSAEEERLKRSQRLALTETTRWPVDVPLDAAIPWLTAQSEPTSHTHINTGLKRLV